MTPLTFTLMLLLQSAPFQSGAPLGTGLEWLTVASVLVPALVLIALVYQGRHTTV